MSYEWVNDYLNKSFEELAYGPEKFDCFGLVWHVNKHQNNTELPRFDSIDYQIDRINAEINSQALSADWQKVTTPQEFDCVVMRRAGEAYHVGVWLDVDGGKVLHATQKGILCNDLGGLHRMSFNNISYYRFAHVNH